MDHPILLVGVGGVGIEILKCLCLEGATGTAIVDQDCIEAVNLNRLFPFTSADVGRSKAVSAADYFNASFPNANLRGFPDRIQNFSESFFSSFETIFIAVDNVETRRWVNAMACHTWRTVKRPSLLIDCGCEGLRGSVRSVRFDRNWPCLECTLQLYTGISESIPLCASASRPRTIGDCVHYAVSTLPSGQGELFLKDPENVRRIADVAAMHARAFNIPVPPSFSTEAVLEMLSITVPSLACSNAYVAGCAVAIAEENDSNFLFVNATDGFYQEFFLLERTPSCLVCGDN